MTLFEFVLCILSKYPLMNKTEKKLILGMGNDILTDDGIGPRLVSDLAKLNLRPDVSFDISGCGGLEILEFVKGYDKVIFIDAIHTRYGKPGDVYCFSLSDFQETSHLSSLHDINFQTALTLGKKLNIDLPDDIQIIAIEIVEDMEFSEELTPSLKKNYPRILKKVLAHVRRIME